MSRRKTKIVATLGPACSDPRMLEEMYRSGVDVARINMSHGSDDQHREAVFSVLRVRESELPGRPLALMLDTRGPELRIIGLDEPLDLVAGSRIKVAGRSDPAREDTQGDPSIRANVPHLVPRVPPGSKMLIDDGRVELEIEGEEDGWLIARNRNAARILPGKGVAFPGVSLSLPFLSDEDVADMELAVEVDADWIALSFVQEPANILQVRDYLGDDAPGLIAKIETLVGYENLDGILQVVDGIMIGRGDLGVDCPPEDIPLIQKDIIRRCNGAGIPVITATQMLESMMESPVATRAEASDVANAILDGTDAVMLSGETAAGSYPRETVATMARIIERTESGWRDWRDPMEVEGSQGVTEAVARSAVWIADRVGAEAVLTPTQSGHTGIMVSRYRPSVPVVAVTSSTRVWRRLALVWGVYPLLKDPSGDVVEDAGDVAMAAQYVSPGARVVVTSGYPQGVPGTTNALQVKTLGTILAQGSGVGRSMATGTAVVETQSGDFSPDFSPGDVLVLRAWRSDMGDIAYEASAIVAEEPGLSSPAALAGLGWGIPVVVGVDNAADSIPPGTQVTVDAHRGIVYSPREPGGTRTGN
ncbi:MAG: pyruvate kinase [Clostridia bacterium]